MKSNKITRWAIIFMLAIWLFIALERGTSILEGVDIYIFILIFLISILDLLHIRKVERAEKQGLPAEDELSLHIKQKTGFQAYRLTIYLWLFLFMFRNLFPTIELILGTGLIITILLHPIIQVILKKRSDEK